MSDQTIPVKIVRELEAEASIEEVIECAVKDPNALSALLLALAQRIFAPTPFNSDEVRRTAINAINRLSVMDAAHIQELGMFLLERALFIGAVHRGELVLAEERGK